jgi:WD40 repeat protein
VKLRAILGFLACALRMEATPIVALTFSPDGDQLISNGPRCLVVRSPVTGAEESRIACDLPKITAIAFHGSNAAVTGGTPKERGAVWLMNWNTKSFSAQWNGLDDLATCVAFNHDGTRIAVGSADETARVLDVTDKTAVRESFALRGHAAAVLGIAFLPQGRAIVTTSVDRSIKAWSGEGGRLIRTFSQHTDAIHAIAVRPTAPGIPIAVATTSDDRTLRIWQPEIGRMVRIVRGFDAASFTVVYARDGKSIFTGGRDGVIRRVDAESDAILEQWQAHEDAVLSLAVSPDGRTLASGDWSGKVKLWKVKELASSTAR